MTKAMTFPARVLTYAELCEKLGDGRRHLLLGNGFSIACDPIFGYPRLYDAAVGAGLSSRAQRVFARLGTNNFEGVMRLLDDSHWVATEYGLLKKGSASPMLTDVEVVKKTLVGAVANSHLPDTGSVSDEKKDAALDFLSPYHNIFTTNYDLLIYWVVMHASGASRWRDGFGSDEHDPDAPYVVFSERLGNQRGLFYIHGALHLYLAHGELRKHCWIRSHKPLTQLIQEGLIEGRYPLFVAEGSPDQKLEQIQRAGYLWYCLDKLVRIEGPLVVFGHSLGESDQHIANAIADNPKLGSLAVGLHGDPSRASNQAIFTSVARIKTRREQLRKRRTHAKPLEIRYYDSESAKAWG